MYAIRSYYGNLDPNVLLASPEAIVRETKAIIDAFGPADTGHVFNLGHGISQFTPPEHVTVLVDTVHEYSRRQRQKNQSLSTPDATYAQK